MESEIFYQRQVVDFNPAKGIEDTNCAYRIIEEYVPSVKSIGTCIDIFCLDPKVHEVRGLLLSMCGECSAEARDGLINKLVQNKEKLEQVDALFIGDFDIESYILWTLSSKANPLFESSPKLKFLHLKVNDELSLGEIKHDQLESLVIHSTGMSIPALKELSQADLPKLKHLEIWLGDEETGWFEGSISDVEALLEPNLFPELTSLSFKHSSIGDEIVYAISKKPLSKMIKSLDLLSCSLTDEDIDYLLSSPEINQLDYLNLGSNYLSDEMVERLHSTLSIETILTDYQRDEDDRYDECGE